MHDQCLRIAVAQNHMINDNERSILNIVMGGFVCNEKISVTFVDQAKSIITRIDNANRPTPAPETLDELFQFMKNNEHWDGAPMICGNQLDWTSLPTFGGDEPTSTDKVWSWDNERLIVGRSCLDIDIITRKEYLDE